MPLWKKLRHRLEAALLRGFARIVPRLPRGSCVRLANALGEIAARLDRRGRAIALDNLRCAFGTALSPAQRLDVMRASYRNFARTIVDLFWAPALVRRENRRWLEVTVAPETRAAVAAGRGAVLLTMHFGNWEWASLAAPLGGMPALAVAEDFKNPALTAIFNALREATGQRIIPQEQSILKMLRAVKRGGFAAYLADLTLRPGDASTVIRAFDMEMCVSILHAALASRGGALVVPAVCLPDARGGCRMEFLAPFEIAPGATARQIAQRCWDFFEPHIRQCPGLWLWAYKHFRYRPRSAGREYPAYANTSGAFEKLRARELGA